MRYILLLISAFAAFGAGAQDTEFEYVIDSLPVFQLSAVEASTQLPVPYASITVEYADSIMNCTTDSIGFLDFTPLSFPLTVTANAEGMLEATTAFMRHPKEPIVILMAREPAEEPKKEVALVEE